MECARRSVPNDNSCLFYAVAYLVDGPDAVSDATQKELRRVCAEAATADPDPEARAVLLGSPVDEYAEWIQKPHNWGGEHEIIALANHFRRRICVVSVDATLCYGEKGRRSTSCTRGRTTTRSWGSVVRAPRRRSSSTARARRSRPRRRDIAVRHREGRAARRVGEDLPHPVLRLRREARRLHAFQAHCGEVEHGDDFAFECETSSRRRTMKRMGVTLFVVFLDGVPFLCRALLAAPGGERDFGARLKTLGKSRLVKRERLSRRQHTLDNRHELQVTALASERH